MIRGGNVSAFVFLSKIKSLNRSNCDGQVDQTREEIAEGEEVEQHTGTAARMRIRNAS